MRIRSLLALTTGGALGASTMYLLDPEHGEMRRHDAFRQAGRGARRAAAVGVRRVAYGTRDVASAALAGYRRTESVQAPPSRPV